MSEAIDSKECKKHRSNKENAIKKINVFVPYEKYLTHFVVCTPTKYHNLIICQRQLIAKIVV